MKNPQVVAGHFIRAWMNSAQPPLSEWAPCLGMQRRHGTAAPSTWMPQGEEQEVTSGTRRNTSQDDLVTLDRHNVEYFTHCFRILRWAAEETGRLWRWASTLFRCLPVSLMEDWARFCATEVAFPAPLGSSSQFQVLVLSCKNLTQDNSSKVKSILQQNENHYSIQETQNDSFPKGKLLVFSLQLLCWCQCY